MDLRRRPPKNAHSLKVLVFRDENETAVSRLRPDRLVRRASGDHARRMQRAGIRRRQTLRETVGKVVVEKQARRRHSGSRRANDAAFTVRRESQARKDVLVGQDWKVGKDFRCRHSARKVTENVPSGDAGSPHASLTEPNVRVNGDAILEVHAGQATPLPPWRSTPAPASSYRSRSATPLFCR